MLDLIKDYIRISTISLSKAQSNVYEFDCIVPDSMPDMAKVLAADAITETVCIDKTKDGATVSFKIKYKILYLTENDKAIKAFSTVSEHSVKIPSESPADEDSLQAICHVEKTDCSYINSRKLSVKASIAIQLLVKSNSEAAICTGLSGVDDIQHQRRSINLSTLSESLTKSFAVQDEIELSSSKAAYKEVLRSDAMLSDIIHSISDGKLQIKGNLQICTLYTADDAAGSLQIIENEIPFNFSLDTDSTEDDTIRHINISLDNYNAEAAEDTDGEKRVLHVDANISVIADAYTMCQQEILTDAYSLSQMFTLSTTAVNAMLVADNISGQFVLRDSATKEPDMPEIAQIVNVTAAPGDYSYTVEDGKITINGNIICKILYLSESDDSPISTFSAVLPFSQSLDCPLVSHEMQALAQICVNHVSFNIMSPAETELRVSVSIKGAVIKNCKFDTICEVLQPDSPYLEEDEDKPAILLYIVQPNDTLWKIAKRYNAPLELLKEVNRLKNPDMIFPGQKLLIP